MVTRGEGAFRHASANVYRRRNRVPSLERTLGMGFIEDVWTVILSDDPDELEVSVERLSQDPIGSEIARTALSAFRPVVDDEKP